MVVDERRRQLFFKKVLKSEDGCWRWTAFTDHGYGNFWTGTRMTRAHRFCYEMLVGPIPRGLQLDHLCRVRNCVNPEHLEPVTQRENFRRGESPTAISVRTDLCQKGAHPLTGDNVITRPSNPMHRECRKCQRSRTKRERKPRAPRRRCYRGHELTPENTIITSSARQPVKRGCRKCENAAQLRRYHARKARSNG